MRRVFRRWQLLVITLLVLLVGLVGWTVWNTHRLQPAGVKTQLVATIEATYQKDLQRAADLKDWQKRDEARKAAAQWRDKRLAQVDEFVDSITKTIFAGEASPEFVELTRVLQEQGVDEALKYISAQKPRLLDEAKSLIESQRLRVRRTLAPLLEEVRLQLTQGDATAAGEGCDKLLALDPNWADVLHEKFLVLTALGDRAVLYGTLSQALKQYKDANSIATRSTTLSEPHPLADHDLLVSYYYLGKVSLRAAKLPAATKYYQKYLEIARRFAANPENSEGRRDLSIAYEVLGDVSLRAGKVASAIEYYRQDLDIATEAARAYPASPQTQRDLMVSYQRLGDATKSFGQFAEAVKLFRDSMEIAKKLASDPKNVRAQRDLAAAYERLGDANSSAGKPQDAITCYRKYLEIAERLADADRASAQARRDLAVAYERLGDESMKVNALDDALAFYGKFKDIAQSLAADPDNAVAQRDLWSAHTRLGHVLSRRGETVQAIAEFDAGERIAAAELAKNRDFFDPYDQACYAALKLLKYSLQHPQPDEKQKTSRGELIEAALSAVQSLLATPFQDLAQIREEPDFSALVEVPKFRALLQQKSREGKTPQPALH